VCGAFVLLLLLGHTAPSNAGCLQKYTKEAMIRDLVALQTALRALDEDTFRENGTRLAAGMECLDLPVPASVHARAYRYIGVLAFFNGEQAESASWFRTSLEIDSAFQWDIQDFESEHPIRILFEAQRDKAAVKPVLLEGEKLYIPPNDRLLIDGREIRQAEATLGRVHILQLLSNDGKVRETWKFVGNSFPKAVLVEPEPVAPPPVEVATTKPPPRSLETRAGADGVVLYKPTRSPWKTPLLVAGGTQLALAGAAYGFSFVTHGRFEDATTTADITSARKTTNTLVMASGALAVTGLASGFAGMQVSGTGFRVNLVF
jgi:hypothetical protein